MAFVGSKSEADLEVATTSEGMTEALMIGGVTTDVTTGPDVTTDMTEEEVGQTAEEVGVAIKISQ